MRFKIENWLRNRIKIGYLDSIDLQQLLNNDSWARELFEEFCDYHRDECREELRLAITSILDTMPKAVNQ